MGVVYKAYDLHLERTVALKVIAPDKMTGDRIERFIQEARATAKLKHSNIVAVFEVGNVPQNYFAMEYIPGDTLSQIIKKGKVKEIAKLIYQLADALSYVHEQGIIHRDLKPANVILAGEQPKLMDFGLAKVENKQISQAGSILGTPAYMSPEQIQGSVDYSSDIYSLGACIYETLVGRPPFQGGSYANISKQILSQDPIAPRIINPNISIELEAICLKCLEKKSLQRYPNARALAQDLQNFIENRPIVARAPKPMSTITALFLI